MFFLGGNFVPGLLCTLKPQNTKNLRTFSKKTLGFPALAGIVKQPVE